MVATAGTEDLQRWRNRFGTLVESASVDLERSVALLERPPGHGDCVDALLATAVLACRASAWLDALPVPDDRADILFRAACRRCESAGMLVCVGGHDQDVAARSALLLRQAAREMNQTLAVIDRSLADD